MDLLAAAALTVAAQAELWLAPPPDAPTAAIAAATAVGTVSFAWHRVAPLPALTVGLTGLVAVPGALGVDPAASFGWFVTALAFMVSAGYHARRPGIALALAFAMFAAGIVLQKGWVVADIVYAWMLAGGAWLAGRAIAARTLRAELSEQRAAAAEQQAQWRAAAAVVEERLRIAREMHDVVSHGLSVMTLHVSGVRRLLRPEQERERAALETAERTGREALGEMHRMLGVLRAPDADEPPSPGLARLPDLVEQARAAGVRMVCRVTGEPRPLPSGVDLAAFRIVQEAVTNVLRHAGACVVECTVHYEPGAVGLEVVDDGAGAGSRTADGHGLAGMRERAEAHGGTVTAGPRAGGGFAVHAVLPAPEPSTTLPREGP